MLFHPRQWRLETHEKISNGPSHQHHVVEIVKCADRKLGEGDAPEFRINGGVPLTNRLSITLAE